MKKKPVKIAYDKESSVLSLEMSQAKSVDSDLHGSVVIDYDKRGNVVRVNLYGFSFDAFRRGFRTVREFARRSRVAVVVS